MIVIYLYSVKYRTLLSALTEIAKTKTKALFVTLGEEALPEQIGSVEIRIMKRSSCNYQATDLYFNSTRADTFPTTGLEALACGIPVVATATGGIPEQIEDGITGFLTPQGEAEAMAARIIQLLKNDQLRLRMGTQAADAAKKNFDLEKQVKEYIDWYIEIIIKWRLEHNFK